MLRAITPRSRALELYPVKLAQDGIYISLEAGTQGGVGARSTKGGADSSIEANNVFSLEPKMYVQEKGKAPGGFPCCWWLVCTPMKRQVVDDAVMARLLLLCG